ncbi:TonB-dependent receptor family protein [Terasakiispira papahanaumokuakeensis]|nr:TonB-dependent receptor [Terasakiispira papahanaumokuakeensis]
MPSCHRPKYAHPMLRSPLALALIGLASITHAEPQSLSTLTIKAPRIDRDLYSTPAAVSSIGEESISQGQQRLKLDETLNTEPGIFLQNRENFAQGERIAIRGFGSRAQFGVRGVTVMVDGIPYTLVDGQAQLDAIDLNSAQRIEVIRGPASVLYGNAAGGVLSITTSDGQQTPPGTTIRAEGGSDGYGQLSLKNSGQNGPWSHSVSVSGLNFDGYRDQSHVEKYLLNSKLRRQLDNDRALTLIINLMDNPRSEDPGALTRAQVKDDRTQSGKFTEKFETGQTVDQQVIGLQYEDLSAGPGELYLKSFFMQRDFEQQLPYPGDSLISYDRDYYGASAEYRQYVTMGPHLLHYTAGVEARRQQDHRDRKAISFAGHQEGLTQDETQTATTLGAFAQTDMTLPHSLTLTLGGRFDRVKLEADDHFMSNGDQSGDKTFNEWSGSLGLSYRYQPNHQAYLNISTAYETPTFSEFANPNGTGGFNASIDPQKSVNHELGLRGDWDTGINYDFALFWIDVRDELVPYELAGDSNRTFYRNAGDTTRKGIELSLGWQIADNWRIDSALTLAQYEFDDYPIDGQNFSGHRLPGLPEQTWTTQLQWQDQHHRFATLETRYIGDMVADDANTVDVDDYWLLNLRAGNGWQLGQSTLLTTYLGVRNLLDKDHYANVRINASNNRYFEPAADRTYYAGVEVSF